jgi:iron complex transport system ATP-binding protein
MDKKEIPVIQVRDLSVGYGNKTVANHIDFNLISTEFCAIIGVNGIGKSTLLRTLAKLQLSIAGEILIAQQNLEKYSPLNFAKKSYSS